MAVDGEIITLEQGGCVGEEIHHRHQADSREEEGQHSERQAERAPQVEPGASERSHHEDSPEQRYRSEGEFAASEPQPTEPHVSETPPLVLYVGGFDRFIDDKAVFDLISQAGPVQSVSITRDPRSGESRKFAFVTLTTREAGEEAIKLFHRSTELSSQSLSVEWVRFLHILSFTFFFLSSPPLPLL